MRRPAVVAWAAVAAWALLSFGAPVRSAAVDINYDYLGWLGYQDQTGNTSFIPLPISIVPGPGGILMGTITNWSFDCNAINCPGVANDGFVIDNLDLTLDPDPVLTFGTTVTDVGAPSAFSFVYQQVIAATAAPGTATASLQGGTSNGGGTAGQVTVTPNSPPGFITTDTDGIPELMVYSLSTDGGGTWQNVGLDLGPAFASNPSQVTDTYGPFNPASVSGPAASGNYDTMRVDVNFSLSGGNDKFQYSGNATITQGESVPEPTTGALLGLGLLGFALRGRRSS
jgi:PEP-CTERM motif